MTQTQNQIATVPATDAPKDVPTAHVKHWVVPSADVLTKDGDIRVLVDVPGVALDGVDVKLHDGVIEMSAARADKPRVGYRRRFALPDLVDVDGLAASLAHGVLTLTLPRAAEAKPRAIEVVST